MSDLSTSESVSTRPGGHTARWIALSVGVVLIVFIAVLATRNAFDDKGISSGLIGKPVPAVVGQTLDGDTFDIDEQRGRWVVVNFFATWCTPCVVEHPELVAFTEQHADDPDVSVVSIAYDTDGIEKFFDDNGGEWPVIVTNTGPLSLEFGVTGVPESYVIDPNGTVVAKFEGVTAKALNELIVPGLAPTTTARPASSSGGAAASTSSSTSPTVGAP